MTITHDRVQPTDAPQPTGSAVKRRLLAGLSLLLVCAVGVAVGVLIPRDTAELDAATNELRSAQSEIRQLESSLAAAEDENNKLSASLDTAEVEAANVAAAERRLDAREERLDGRSSAVDDREQALDVREQSLDEREQSIDVNSEFDDTGSTREAPLGSSDFDRAWAMDIASDIVQDVRTIDHRMQDGIAVSSALDLLSGNYPRLLDAGIPPGVDDAEYSAQLSTLEEFSISAADLYYADPTEATAKYAVVREQTGVLLDDLNAAIATDFELP